MAGGEKGRELRLRARTPIRLGLALLCVTLGFAVAAPFADATPGGLDPSFGSGGIATTNFSHEAAAWGMALQPDGKIVITGEAEGKLAVARYDENGTLDTSFGSGGIVITGVEGIGHAIGLQADGKIVVGGTYQPSGSAPEEFIVARFNTDGTLDTSFGSGGIVTMNFGEGSWLDGLVLQPDGKIVAAGAAEAETEGGFPGSVFALARFNEDGSLDSSFGSGGKVTTDFGNSDNAELYTIVRQSNGKLVVAGMVNLAFAVTRYNEDGSVDTGFGADGLTRLPFGENNSVFTSRADALAVQPDGKIVAAGAGELQFALARFNENGTLDTSFGSSGKVTTSLPYNSFEDYSQISALQLQSDGRIVVAGVDEEIPYEGTIESSFALARYNPNGALDATFGTGGLVTTQIDGTGSRSWANGLALQPDGKIIAVGETETSGPTFGFALARYEGGGPPPPAYHRLTVVKAGTGTGTVTSNPAAIKCGASCSAEYVEGETVTLTAAADADSTFAGWSGGDCSGTDTCQVTLATDQTVTATFTHSPSSSGEEAAGGGATTSGQAPSPSTPTSSTPKKALRCHKGFKKRKVHGKQKCVKAKGRHAKHAKGK